VQPALRQSGRTSLTGVDPLLITVAVMAPGIAVMAPGVVLLSRTGLRRQASSVWGLRLFYLGLSLMFLVPGAAAILAVMVGRLMSPSAVAAVVLILLGSGILYGLRMWWNDPARGGPSDWGGLS
jgi:hypothetical protein